MILFRPSLIVLACLNLVLNVIAQPGTQWVQTFGGDEHDSGDAVLETSDGGLIIVGSTQSYSELAGVWNMWVIKTDANGEEEWSQAYGGVADCGGTSIVEDAYHNFVIAGNYSPYPYDDNDMWLLVLDPDGDILFSRTYGGRGRVACSSMIQTSDGGYAMAGITNNGGESNFYMIKLDSLGQRVWSQEYGGDGDEICHSVIESQDGGLLLAGYTTTFGNGNSDIWLVKTDADGDSLWSRTYGGEGYDNCNSIIQMDQENIVLAGSTTSFGAGDSDFWVLKVNADGDTVWSKTLGGREDDNVKSCIRTFDGGIALAGPTLSFGEHESNTWLVKLDADGDSLWSETYRLGYDERVRHLSQTSDSSFILIAQIYDNQNGIANDYDLSILKTEADPLSIDIDDDFTIPQDFYLYPSYPNPFNSATTIHYGLPKAVKITINVFDNSGRHLIQLFDGFKNTGFHTIPLSLQGFQSGTYFVNLQSGSQSQTQEIILLK